MSWGQLGVIYEKRGFRFLKNRGFTFFEFIVESGMNSVKFSKVCLYTQISNYSRKLQHFFLLLVAAGHSCAVSIYRRHDLVD